MTSATRRLEDKTRSWKLFFNSQTPLFFRQRCAVVWRKSYRAALRYTFIFFVFKILRYQRDTPLGVEIKTIFKLTSKPLKSFNDVSVDRISEIRKMHHSNLLNFMYVWVREPFSEKRKILVDVSCNILYLLSKLAYKDKKEKGRCVRAHASVEVLRMRWLFLFVSSWCM